MMTEHLTHSFSSKELVAHIGFEPEQIRIQFRIMNVQSNSTVNYIASAPAVRNNSFTGSGLPYPSEEVAFENTPFKGVCQLTGQAGEITISDLPNSYYIKLGSVLIPPSVRISYKDAAGNLQIIYVVLCDAIPYRTLTYDYRRSSPQFYDVDLPVRSQDQILRDSAYDPTYDVRNSFWSLRPPY
jgi:hypothetical protein